MKEKFPSLCTVPDRIFGPRYGGLGMSRDREMSEEYTLRISEFSANHNFSRTRPLTNPKKGSNQKEGYIKYSQSSRDLCCHILDFYPFFAMAVRLQRYSDAVARH